MEEKTNYDGEIWITVPNRKLPGIGDFFRDGLQATILVQRYLVFGKECMECTTGRN